MGPFILSSMDVSGLTRFLCWRQLVAKDWWLVPMCVSLRSMLLDILSG